MDLIPGTFKQYRSLAITTGYRLKKLTTKLRVLHHSRQLREEVRAEHSHDLMSSGTERAKS
jgi:hypothetical protein